MARVDEQIARVREMIAERDSWIAQAEERVGAAHPWKGWAEIIERETPTRDALEALLTRVQAYEAVVEAARALRHGTAEIQAEARDRMDRALDALPGEGER